MPSRRNRSGEYSYAANKPTTQQLIRSRDEANRASVDFLRIDAETALTLSNSALQSQDTETRERNRRAARHGYDSILTLMPKVTPGAQDEQNIQENLRRLKQNLERLGEVF